MRDPFESSPAPRLGDAKAKSRKIPVPQEGDELLKSGATIVTTDSNLLGSFPSTEIAAADKPPSLAPEFCDAFGEAFSKPSHETRRPVGDGAMRYEPRGFVEVRPEVLSEKEFREQILANHTPLVAKKDAEK